MMETVMGFFLMDTFFNGNAANARLYYGYLYALGALANLAVSFFIFKPLKEKLGASTTIAVGTTLQIAGYLLMPNSQAPWLFLVAFGLQTIGGRLLAPLNSAFLMTLCP